ncbi:MAG TPA: L-histidine N(alpha)-methyltransferase [Planctomycetes bacterium]|nr:L-histidine N(alpha)-methyltransferase [Planctomycetota bacterium]HIL50850.1 L-histidine N(alpha)-methyltransferase [Planctomycetota bacterium]
MDTEEGRIEGGRFTLLGEAPGMSDSSKSDAAEFASEVREGLIAEHKRISSRWLYDEEGSKIFEEICELDEYYLTRVETDILSRCCPRIVKLAGSEATCVELGSGNALKTRLLFDAFFEKTSELTYVSVDISPSALVSSAQELLGIYTGLRVIGIAGEYSRGIEWMSKTPGQKLVLWLGSNIGNLNRGQGVEFLRTLGEHLTASDKLLLGIDLRKQKHILEAAYNDSSGVTARFNKNLLRRINNTLGANFDLQAFTFEALYFEDSGCVRSHLKSDRQQRVRIDSLELEVSFECGETIHTEDSFKYSFEEIAELAAQAGFERQENWTDAEGRYSLELFSPQVAT